MLKLGSMIGSKRVVKIIGEGAMGRVYLAHDLALRKAVAIKILRPELAINERAAARFKLEAIVQARLGNENFVQVYELLESPDMLGFVMEYVDGPDLNQFIDLQGGRVAPKIAIEIMHQLLRALEYAHRQQLVHRDIKPSNIMILKRDGKLFVKIMDFGIAKALDPTYLHNLTIVDAVLFTRGYSSPEQVNDASSADRRSDIYSLGVTFYRMLTGRFPIESSTDTEYIQRVATVQPVPPSAHMPSLPKSYDRITLKALAKDPADRYQYCHEFLAELPGQTQRPPRRGNVPNGSGPGQPPIILWALVGVAGVILILALFFSKNQRIALPPPEPTPTVAVYGTLYLRVDQVGARIRLVGPQTVARNAASLAEKFESLEPGYYEVYVDYGASGGIRKTHASIEAGTSESISVVR